MRDVQDGDPEPVAQVGQQVEDAEPDGDVQHRDGLVGEQHLGLRGERPRDGDALPLPAGQLVRELVDVPRGGREVHALQQLGQGRLQLGPAQRAPAGLAPVQAQRPGQGVAHGVHGVQGGEGVLEDHLHAPHVRAEGPAASQAGLGAVEQHLPARDGDESGQQPGDRGLAGPRLPHHGQDLAAVELEVHAVHGVDRPGGRTAADATSARPEVLGEAVRGQHRCARAHQPSAGSRFIRIWAACTPVGWGWLYGSSSDGQPT